uniref:Uncharacterized protein n=1 Tax=Strombidinopsis acuminata TaxID=141414 RepID=A0A7S3RNN5_9SPIT|mmetsp:Transcript_115085/g.159649  ORF Transcript_115085/g.159649 Transcript_115085/m.159649 type:complete len:110 (+) Transcript_115085:209-538(+)|eukprot:CAMPEP_0176356108 /NCGR_PEP_ID=MMETSP0126-20121128/13779_1 /TAXON_ID=141414 ORGANISM="Strombidinopsis acuminatum, Strain SPMC142" /NCGR_SAMPLE_ID=MMETSP0126 /ASSEMBLY_ACC=CAM_ASM_000229 /LENGTH=109 /DNA_ID=CAMNT_0017709057 /DNA_START=210 /DNA_END=539 /DNA_ORIENTATION=-
MLLQKRIVEKHAPEAVKPTIEDVPSHVKGKFFGVPSYDQDRYTNNEQLAEAAVNFYGGGELVQEMYARNQETLDQASAKFHAADGSTASAPCNQLTMTYAEARAAAHNQ